MQPAGIQNVVQNPVPDATHRPNGDSALGAGEAIIRAEKIEKYYAQPSQNRIQTDFTHRSQHCTQARLSPCSVPIRAQAKSTMLRMLSGSSLSHLAGQVYWHEKPIAEAEINVAIVCSRASPCFRGLRCLKT